MPKRFTPTPAMLVALLALFLAAGGVGYAATSIGSGQITNNSVRSADIRDGTLALRDLSPKTRSTLRGAGGVRGHTGARGLEGATGPVGPTSAAGATNVVARTNTFPVSGTTTQSGTVQCQLGERATGGGGGIIAGSDRPLLESGPVDASGTFPIAAGAVPTGWRVEVSNGTGVAQIAFVSAVCAAP
jgi:hypothetical protein